MLKQHINKFLLIFFLFFLSSQHAFGIDKIADIRHWSAPDHTRVVLDIKGTPSYKKFTLTNPDRLVVDFKDTIISLSQNKIVVEDRFIKQIRFGNFKKDVLRIVFDLGQPTEAEVFTFSKLPGKTDRLVIEFSHPDLKKRAKEARVKIGTGLKQNKIIVIDPGHGGEDPGAIGPGGTMEKDVVLTFARSLKRIFDAKEGYQAFLTREGDYFIPLRDRIKIAGDYGADLFISVHVDSNHNRTLQGSSVYCLSLKGASDEAARCLAEKENASDRIGGISFSQNDDLNFTLLDLALTNTINSSLRLGSLILKEIKSVHTIKFDKPKQAGFRVLKTTETPSVLVELGFVSNPSEEQRLKRKKFQIKLAKAIASASDQFLNR